MKGSEESALGKNKFLEELPNFAALFPTIKYDILFYSAVLISP